MKLAITGKGGTGKTTIAGLLAHFFNKGGYQVLAVDADPDPHLASALGIPEKKRSSIIPISSLQHLIKERTGADPKQVGQIFRMNPRVSDIPEKYCFNYQGIKLLVMGGITKGGSGCACPQSALIRSLLSEIILNRQEVVVIDMEAGIEHLGRSVAKAVDRMLIVVEPSSQSLATAQKIKRLARDINIRCFGIIGNKIRKEEQRKWINGQFAPDEILGMISYHGIILDSDFYQKPLIDNLDEKLRAEFEPIYKSLIPK